MPAAPKKATTKAAPTKKVPGKRPDWTPPPPAPGRPTCYTEEMAAYICAQLARGRSLNSVCKEEGIPEMITVYRWLHSNEAFSNMYARAREDQADTLADEITEIADTTQLAEARKIGPNGEEVSYRDAVERSKLRVDARKWVAAKLKPKKYGDRVIHAGDKENPVAVQLISDADALLAKLKE